MPFYNEINYLNQIIGPGRPYIFIFFKSYKSETQSPKFARISHAQPVQFFDRSTEQSGGELCWSVGNDEPNFCRFDYKNGRLYELENYTIAKCSHVGRRYIFNPKHDNCELK